MGFGCGYDIQFDKNNRQEETAIEDEVDDKPHREIFPLPSKAMPGVDARGIDATSVNKFKVSVSVNPDNPIEAVFPRFDEEGNHVGNQIRYKEKQFKCEGKVGTASLFGQVNFPAGGRSVTVTEGYYDTLSSFQLTGSRYPTVGVMSASTAKKEIVHNFEWLNTFDHIVINFDNDEVGQTAAKECASLFQPGKVSILTLVEEKDANAYLMAGKVKEYVNEFHRSKEVPFMPDGLVTGNDPSLLSDIIDYDEPESIPFPWEGLNRSTYGLRMSEVSLFLADTGAGKTTFMKEIEYKLLTDPELTERGYGIGFLHLEETKRDTALGLMSIHRNKPYHLPDTEKSRDELISAYNEVVKTDRVVIWDTFGSNDIDLVLAKIRHMVAMGCRYIVLDHLSIIVSDQSGDERKQLDEISTKLKTLVMNLNVCCVCVMHINRKGEARGSAGPEHPFERA